MKGSGIRAWRVLEVEGTRAAVDADADGRLHSKLLPSMKEQ